MFHVYCLISPLCCESSGQLVLTHLEAYLFHRAIYAVFEFLTMSDLTQNFKHYVGKTSSIKQINALFVLPLNILSWLPFTKIVWFIVVSGGLGQWFLNGGSWPYFGHVTAVGDHEDAANSIHECLWERWSSPCWIKIKQSWHCTLNVNTIIMMKALPWRHKYLARELGAHDGFSETTYLCLFPLISYRF